MEEEKKCEWKIAWRGKCNEPTKNGNCCCEKHQKKCCSCGKPATRECEETGQFVCGFPLCDDCKHITFPNGSNGGVGFGMRTPPKGFKTHIKKSEQPNWDDILEQKGISRDEAIAQGWQARKGFSMELKHGLMGYFPLIHKIEKNREGSEKIIICANRADLKTIWENLPKKKVKVSEITLLINPEETEIVVTDNKRITSDWLHFIKELDPSWEIEETFCYSPGLISSKNESDATFPEE